jgi:signal transduction histidine kinase
MGLERVKLGFGNAGIQARHPSDRPGKARLFAVRRGDEVVGVLDVVSRGPELSGEQIAALQLLADQLAAAIELCQLIADKVKLERELAEKAKMAFLGEMAARIAHNVKNPLSSMKTLVQLLEEDPSLGERVRQDCRLVILEIDRLNANVSQVLRYAKPARDTDRAVDLSKVVASVLTLMRADAERRGVHLEFAPPSVPCLVKGGEEAANDIISNLVVNAIEAGAPEGAGPSHRNDTAHRGDTAHQDHPEAKITVSINGDDSGRGRVLLSVDDQGRGIPADLNAKIFQPFFTTRAGGTGLGLAIVARRAEEIGGAVECVSPLGPGGGTRFVVRFRSAG